MIITMEKKESIPKVWWVSIGPRYPNWGDPMVG